MRYLLTYTLIISLNFYYGQDFVYPSIEAKGQSCTDFVPFGWTIPDSAYGDLIKDGIKDAAIILQRMDSVSAKNSLADTVLTQPRILIILLKNHFDNSFALIEQSNSFILKHDNSAKDNFPYHRDTQDFEDYSYNFLQKNSVGKG